jgi:hypothetical protein
VAWANFQVLTRIGQVSAMALESVHHQTRNETHFVREIEFAASFCDEQDIFNGFANAQFLRNQMTPELLR